MKVPHHAATPPAAAPRLPLALDDGVAVACMALLVLITLLNVVTRYVTSQSFAWTEEISVFLMVIMTLAGAGAAAGRDRHIRLEFVYAGGDAKRRRRLKIGGALVSAFVFALLAALFVRSLADEIKWGETSMGLGVPRWWFTAAAPILCSLVALRAFGVARRAWSDPPRCAV